MRQSFLVGVPVHESPAFKALYICAFFSHFLFISRQLTIDYVTYLNPACQSEGLHY